MLRGVGLAVGLAAALALGGCREPDGPIGPVRGGAGMVVSSLPQGGRIFLDDRDTGLLTPDTVRGLSGSHTVGVRLDTLGLLYEYTMQVAVFPGDSLLHAHAPLLLVCNPADLAGCHGRLHRYHQGAGVRFATSPLGSLFLRQGEGQGVFWPATSPNSYVSGAMPVFAAMLPAGAISLGIYDHAFLAGRPLPGTASGSGVFRLDQETWILPPQGTLRRSLTARGMSVRQQVAATDSVPGVIVVRLRFRNITADPEYRPLDPFVGQGVTFTRAYIGLAVDPDIGDSGDDWFSYDPELDMVFAYDARFDEPVFTGDAAGAPGLVGLRALRVPPGSTVMLNGWTRAGATADWRAGQASEVRGYDMLSGEAPYAPAHPDRRIGHLPPVDGDVRLSVTAGPLTLAPGEEAEIVLALLLAAPAAGTYVPGNVVPPGEPLDTQRALYRVAAPLRSRARAAEALGDGRDD